MIKVQILTQLPDGQLGLHTHEEDNAKAAQEYAAHWTYELIKDGFIPVGAMITYLLTATGSMFLPSGEVVVVDTVSYLHTEEAPVTTE